jgi:hypothetical protein
MLLAGGKWHETRLTGHKQIDYTGPFEILVNAAHDKTKKDSKLPKYFSRPDADGKQQQKHSKSAPPHPTARTLSSNPHKAL